MFNGMLALLSVFIEPYPMIMLCFVGGCYAKSHSHSAIQCLSSTYGPITRIMLIKCANAESGAPNPVPSLIKCEPPSPSHALPSKALALLPNYWRFLSFKEQININSNERTTGFVQWWAIRSLVHLPVQSGVQLADYYRGRQWNLIQVVDQVTD